MDLLARGRHAVVYVLGVLAPSVVTLGIVAVDRDVLIPNISLLYLPGIMAMAIYFGTKPSLVTATVSAVEYDIFLLKPIFSLSISHLANVLAFLVFVIVAVCVAELAAKARERAEVARRRATESAMLYDLGRALMSGHDVSALLKTVTRQIVDVFEANFCCIFVPDASGDFVPAAQTVREPAQGGAARTVRDHDRSRNVFGPHPGGDDHTTIVEPLRAGEHVIGVMEIGDRVCGRPFDPNEKRLATVFAAQAALALARAQGEHERLRLSVLEESDKLKSALLSAVSHDLRTPLASIKASATSLLLADGLWATPDGRELLQTIDHESDRLNRLVGNLLDLSRIEAGVLRPALDWYSVGDVVDGMTPHLTSILGSRRLQINVQDGIGLIRVDLLRIEELLINLMENAGRYTPVDSPIELRVGADVNGLSIAVVDHGPGIPESQRHNIFEAFARGREHTDRDHGTGLGLAICRGIATAHGGVLTVTDTPGGGATFVLALPPECVAPGDDADSTHPAAVRGAPALPGV